MLNSYKTSEELLNKKKKKRVFDQIVKKKMRKRFSGNTWKSNYILHMCFWDFFLSKNQYFQYVNTFTDSNFTL